MQGVFNSVKDFAAGKATSEDRQRAQRQIVDVLRLDRVDEVQRRMAELAQEKVNVALVQSAPRADRSTAANPGARIHKDESMMTMEGLQDIMAEQRAYKRIGFTTEVVTLQKEIDSLRGKRIHTDHVPEMMGQAKVVVRKHE